MPPATIQKVAKLEPIPGADAIEVATVMDWKCVVKKSQFKEGDLGVFLEIDSIPPDTPDFAFLKEGHQNMRVKTIRLRGQISQGLFMPLSIVAGDGMEEGLDVSEILGATHYEKELPANLRGKVKGTRPRFIPKTDETQIQSCSRVLQEIQGLQAYATVKADGSSCTFYWRNGEFGVCSRNTLYTPEDTSTYSELARKTGIKEKMEKLGLNIAIQGEMVGPGIQANKMGLKEVEFQGFNVLYIDDQRYADYEEMARIFDELGIKPVELVFSHKTLAEVIGKEDYDVKDILALAEGNYPGTTSPREGIVIRPMVEAYSRELKGRLSFKAVSPTFLLKYKE